jgi:outer membrane protein W
MRMVLTALILIAVVPGRAQCQSAPDPIARGDVSAALGWFSADHPGSNSCCAWSSGLFKGLQGGYYWNDHLKTEVEIAATGETQAYTYVLPPAPGSSYTSKYHRYRDVLISGGQFYQFGRNAYFHPFVGAGLDVDRERHEIEFESFTSTGARIVTPESISTRVLVRPFVAGGFKAYFSERVFFRTDLKAAFSNSLDQITWRLGFGIDF